MQGSPEERRSIGAALVGSGLADHAVDTITGKSQEHAYSAFSLLFLVAKAGEVEPLMRIIEEHPNIQLRLAVIKLLALSGEPKIVTAFFELAQRSSLPLEVRSAVREAIFQIVARPLRCPRCLRHNHQGEICRLMSDMLQLVVKIWNSHVRRYWYYRCLNVADIDDKLQQGTSGRG